MNGLDEKFYKRIVTSCLDSENKYIALDNGDNVKYLILDDEAKSSTNDGKDITLQNYKDYLDYDFEGINDQDFSSWEELYYAYIEDQIRADIEDIGLYSDGSTEKDENNKYDFYVSLDDLKTLGFDVEDEPVLENKSLTEDKDLLSWEEIFNNAEGTTLGQTALKVKDQARAEVEDLMKKDGIDVDSLESVEDEIEKYVADHNIKFDNNGSIITEAVSKDVVEYFGMQDNTDEEFKANVEKEYTKLRSKYPDKEMILNGDFGTYLGTEKATPIEKGEYITVYDKVEEAVNAKTGTYWSGNGKYQDLLRKINNKLLPETGTVAKISGIIPEDLFAKFVDLQNEYYRLFNDGDIPKADQDYFMTDTVSDLPIEGVEEAHKREEDRVNDVIKSIMSEVPDIEEKLNNTVEEVNKIENKLTENDGKKYSKEDIKNLLDNGNIVVVGGKDNYTPSRFLIKDNRLYFQNVEISGNVFLPHPKSIDEMIDYISNLQDEGFSVTSQDWDNTVKLQEDKSIDTTVFSDDIIDVVKTLIKDNKSDDFELGVLTLASELLDVSIDTLNDLINTKPVTEDKPVTSSRKVSEMDTVDIIVELEGGELVLQDKEDWDTVKALAKELSLSQGFYGRLFRDMTEYENEYELNFPIVM